ncbi:MAG: FtsB family cell division protein [Thermovenabulum sp.]|uniref:FtsB family cell division protein n=1 Tax=Thermovenabulum sp. TaxID=3100335 RepID=UPI003C7EC0ED
MKGPKFKIRHILLLLFVFYFISTLIFQQLKLIELKREEENLKASINEALQEKQRLMKEIELLNDKSYIEKIAREQLRLVKPGEFIYVISDDK